MKAPLTIAAFLCALSACSSTPGADDLGNDASPSSGDADGQSDALPDDGQASSTDDGMQDGSQGSFTPSSGMQDGASGADPNQAGNADGSAGTTGSEADDVADDGAAMDGPDTASGAADASASAQALSDLQTWLATDAAARPALHDQPFAQTALTRDDAASARDALWADRVATIEATRGAEHDAKRITLGDFTLRYETVVLGDEPATGRDLFISMHGGGSGPASTNDSQWRNQVSLATGYDPEHALWVAPRAPTDDWNMWFKDHIDPLFDRLITNMIVFEGIDPDRVYLNGYSAGGDGVYGLSPRTADRYAGAAMSAGHPNGVSLANLRNVAFALHCGGSDSAFDRNLVSAEYIDKLQALQDADPGGYAFQGMVHQGLPHWMNLADAVSIPFMQGYTRSAVPERVVWEQHEVTQSRMYWLAVDAAEQRSGTRVVASYEGQTVTLEEVDGVGTLRVWLRDDMLDLDQPVIVQRGGDVLFEGTVTRSIAVLWDTLEQREDPSMVYAAALDLTL